MASPRVLDPTVQIPLSRQQRVTRSPSTPFNVLGRPWSLTPFCLFPVLPGETMTSCLIQGQFWTDPLKALLKNNPWTHEMWLFYVKFRDFPGWEVAADGLGRDLIQMIEVGEVLNDPAYLINSYVPSVAVPKNGINVLYEGIKRITECYFREEGQAYNAALDIDQLPLVHAYAGGRRDVWERLALGTMPSQPSAEERRVAMPSYVGGTVYQAWADYAAMRNQSAAELQAMDYEDIVRSAGGKAVVRKEEREDLHIPELLGMIRHWDYPVNTVEPTTGSPSVAFGHRFKQSLKQNFRFPEFGYIVGLQTWRPKAFLKNQQGLFAQMLKTRENWFMANQDPDADAHYMQLQDVEGPFTGVADAANASYAIDVRNLFWEGEQFTNWDPSLVANGAVVSLPTVAGGIDYPSQSDQDAVFATAGGRIRMDGVIDISVKTYPVVNPRAAQDDRQFANRD